MTLELYKNGGGLIAMLDDTGAYILLSTPSNGTKLLVLGEELKDGVTEAEPGLEPKAELVGKELESAELGAKKEDPREELLDVCTKILRMLTWWHRNASRRSESFTILILSTSSSK
jgi:hypothetical protein